MAFEWTTRREKAAALVADDAKPDTVIASECGVTRRSLAKWKQAPEFKARVSEHRAAIAKIVAQNAVKQIRHRLANKDRASDALLDMADAVMNNFRRRHPDGTLDNDAPMIIHGGMSNVAKDAKEILMAAAKIEGWLVDRQQSAIETDIRIEVVRKRANDNTGTSGTISPATGDQESPGEV